MTDYDTRAEAVEAVEAVEAIKAHLTEFLVDHDAEEFAWNILNDLGEVGWATGRAETTTATDEDMFEQAWEVIVRVRDAHPRTVDDAPTEDIVDALIDAGLLATTRTRPTRDDLARAIASGYEHDHPTPNRHDYRAADAVLALLADQPTEAEAGARAVEDTAHILRRMELNGMHLTDMDISWWLHERAARLRGGDDQ